eukprot:COSAG01_NODE_1836_length_9084_cov_5.216472_11_plen_56_part_00
MWVVLAIDIGAVGAVGTAARTEYHLLRDIIILMSTIRSAGDRLRFTYVAPVLVKK